MKLNNIKYSIFIPLCSALLASCDSFLDTTPEDLRSPEQIFSTYTSTQNAMFGVYSYVRNTTPFWMPDTYSTSDVDVAYTNVHTFDNGIWDASSAQYDKWNFYYKAIREATYFLQNIDKCTDGKLQTYERNRWKSEVRCLRAYFYAQLMRMYGPVILLKDEQPDFTSLDLQRERDTWDECVEWVANEFWEVAESGDLDVVTTGADYARMSQGIALAFRARLLLQSASPQFNGNPMYADICKKDGTPLFPQEYDPQKWELARQAAQDVIDLDCYELVEVLYEDGEKAGTIDPFTSYKSVFTEAQNKEMIFSYLEDNGYIDKRLSPHFIGGWGGGWSPTQEMVDSYAMESGIYPILGYTDSDRDTPIINQDAEYSETGFTNFTNPVEGVERSTYNMYVNREPRFYVSIIYGGMNWFLPKKASENFYLEMFTKGNNGPNVSHDHFTTGYALAKLAMPEYEANPVKNVKREQPYMRYAEILLNYSEACIEGNKMDDPHYLEYWNMVRKRAGLKNIEEVYPDVVSNPDVARDLIRRERKVEFAFEGINFYDTRRWLTAEKTEKGNIHGMNIKAEGQLNSGKYPDDFFQRTVVEKRVFMPSFYLFPIPQSAINRNQLLVQNYKWE